MVGFGVCSGVVFGVDSAVGSSEGNGPDSLVAAVGKAPDGISSDSAPCTGVAHSNAINRNDTTRLIEFKALFLLVVAEPP
jgi:hypothetical protein